MHADPQAVAGKEKGFALFFNPTNLTLPVNYNLPLYYCGFAPGASVNLSWMNASVYSVAQDAFFNVPVAFELAPRSYNWVAIS